MKAIFVDIDGVLNVQLAPGVMNWGGILPRCIDNLNKIIDRTGAGVFIISSWADNRDLFDGDNLELANFLYERGLRKGSIVGFRRDALSKDDGVMELVKSNDLLSDFIIIDDNPTIIKNEYLKTRFIPTNGLDGLTNKEVFKAVEMLGKMETGEKDRFMGCLVGLAVGDAYGTTYEFTNRKRMPAEDALPDELMGGGPFDMKIGEWTDDTSMALCLAESLVEKGWNTDDQMKRYIAWWQEGYNSVKGHCFDIGGATRSALSSYNMMGNFVVDPQAAGNGVLMRLAPLPMWSYDKENCVDTLAHCAFQSIMTHPSSQSIECSMIMGAIINKILSGEKDKMKILNFDTLLDENSKQVYKELFEKYNCVENRRIEQIKRVEYFDKDADKISGDGYCVFTLEAALWAFLLTDDFESGLKKVVALGDDTDTTGAVYGQIAGAYYGLAQIPWVDKIAWIDKIKTLAEQLCSE